MTGAKSEPGGAIRRAGCQARVMPPPQRRASPWLARAPPDLPARGIIYLTSTPSDSILRVKELDHERLVRTALS
jgi:hypothetical protein